MKITSEENAANATAKSLPADDRNSWVALNRWQEDLGVSETTTWRWRRRGWLRVVNVGGRLFITPRGLAEFERRAASGEFAKANTGYKGRRA